MFCDVTLLFAIGSTPMFSSLPLVRVADCINKHLFSKFYEFPLFSALKGCQFSTVFPFKRNPVYELLLYAPFTHLPRKLR